MGTTHQRHQKTKNRLLEILSFLKKENCMVSTAQTDISPEPTSNWWEPQFMIYELAISVSFILTNAHFNEANNLSRCQSWKWKVLCGQPSTSGLPVYDTRWCISVPVQTYFWRMAKTSAVISQEVWMVGPQQQYNLFDNHNLRIGILLHGHVCTSSLKERWKREVRES